MYFEEVLQDIFSFLIAAFDWVVNLITDKDFYILLIAVSVSALFAFIPQKRQNIQHSIFELMKNQMDLLNQIEIQKYKGASFFIYAKSILKRLYDIISKEINDAPENPTDYYSNPLNKEVLEFSETPLGRDSLKIFYRNKPVMNKDEIEIEFERRKAEYVYEYFFETHYIFVGHYFRHLYNIIKFIHIQHRFWIKKEFYTGLLQAQMSAPELYVLFYNGLKFEKMEKFINEYGLVENLAKKDLMAYSHYKFYNCKMKDRTELPELKDDLDLLLDRTAIKKEFEEKFYILLDQLNSTMNKIEITVKRGNEEKLYRGREFFTYLNYYVKNFYEIQFTYGETERLRYSTMLAGEDFYPIDINKVYNDRPVKSFKSRSEFENDVKILKEMAKHSYVSVHNKYRIYLDPYFNQLLHILKYLESKEKIIKKFDSNISDYINSLQSRLSSTEMLLLFYNGLYYVEMKEYLDKYKLFSGLEVEELIDVKHQNFYNYQMKSRKY